jgi:hypothetical protein
MWVNIEGVWIGDSIYFTLRYIAWLRFRVYCYTHTVVFKARTRSRYLVSAANDRLSPYSFPNYSRVSITSFSQQPLTTTEPQQHSDCSPTNSFHSTVLSCTAFTKLTQLGRSMTYRHIQNAASNSTSTVACRPLPSNGSSSIAYLRSCCLAMTVVSLFVSRSLPSNGSICLSMFYLVSLMELFYLERVLNRYCSKCFLSLYISELERPVPDSTCVRIQTILKWLKNW